MENTQRMVNRLPEHYGADQPGSIVRAVLNSWGLQFEQIEKDTNLLMLSRWFATAKLDDLELMGSMFGVERVADDDEQSYREKLSRTILELLRGTNTPESIRNLVEARMGFPPEIIENPTTCKIIGPLPVCHNDEWDIDHYSVTEDIPTIIIRSLSGTRRPSIQNVSTGEFIIYNGFLRKGALLKIGPDGDASLAGIDVSDRMESSKDLPPYLPKGGSQWRYVDNSATLDSAKFDESAFGNRDGPNVEVKMNWIENVPATFVVKMPLNGPPGYSIEGKESMPQLRQQVRTLVENVKAAGVDAKIEFFDELSEHHEVFEEFEIITGTMEDEIEKEFGKIEEVPKMPAEDYIEKGLGIDYGEEPKVPTEEDIEREFEKELDEEFDAPDMAPEIEAKITPEEVSEDTQEEQAEPIPEEVLEEPEATPIEPDIDDETIAIEEKMKEEEDRKRKEEEVRKEEEEQERKEEEEEQKKKVEEEQKKKEEEEQKKKVEEEQKKKEEEEEQKKKVEEEQKKKEEEEQKKKVEEEQKKKEEEEEQKKKVEEEQKKKEEEEQKKKEEEEQKKKEKEKQKKKEEEEQKKKDEEEQKKKEEEEQKKKVEEEQKKKEEEERKKKEKEKQKKKEKEEQKKKEEEELKQREDKEDMQRQAENKIRMSCLMLMEKLQIIEQKQTTFEDVDNESKFKADAKRFIARIKRNSTSGQKIIEDLNGMDMAKIDIKSYEKKIDKKIEALDALIDDTDDLEKQMKESDNKELEIKQQEEQKKQKDEEKKRKKEEDLEQKEEEQRKKKEEDERKRIEEEEQKRIEEEERKRKEEEERKRIEEEELKQKEEEERIKESEIGKKPAIIAVKKPEIISTREPEKKERRKPLIIPAKIEVQEPERDEKKKPLIVAPGRSAQEDAEKPKKKRKKDEFDFEI